MLTGYLCKQVLRRYSTCSKCCEALKQANSYPSSLSKLVDIKSRGGLIHPNLRFYKLIRHIESCFAKHASSPEVFNETIEEIVSTYEFSFPCESHASIILSYALCYYIRMRMRHFAYQENQKLRKQFVPKKKMAKLTNQ